MARKSRKTYCVFFRTSAVLRNRFQKKRVLAFKKEMDSLSFHKKVKRFMRNTFFIGYFIL